MQIGVLSFWQTHLPLWDRARLLIIDERKRQNDRPLSEVMPKISAALEVARNAKKYQEQFLPGWFDNIDQETRDWVVSHSPNAGGHPHINTMVALQNQAREMLEAIKTPYTEPTDDEIEAVVKQYLESQGRTYDPARRRRV